MPAPRNELSHLRQALEAELGEGARAQPGCECFTCLYGPKLLAIAEAAVEARTWVKGIPNHELSEGDLCPLWRTVDALTEASPNA